MNAPKDNNSNTEHNSNLSNDKTIQVKSEDKTIISNNTGDKTIINDSDDETKMGDLPDMGMLALGAKLKIISNQNYGEEHILTSQEISIGRADENDIILNYPGVSRKHFKIFYKDEKLFIEDLGSKYGIFINKKKIESVTELKHGSIIQIGELTLKYQTSQHGFVFSDILENKTILYPVIIFAVLIFIVISLKILNNPAPQEIKTIKQVTPAANINEEINDMIFEAETLYNQGELNQAITKLNSILQISPNNKKVKELKRKYQQKVLIETKLTRANDCIEAGTLEQARSIINEILDINAKNTKATNLLNKIEKLNKSKEILAILTSAKSYYKNKKYDQSLEMLKKITNPDFTSEVENLKEKIAQTQKADLVSEKAMLLYSEEKFDDLIKYLSKNNSIIKTNEKLINLQSKSKNIISLKIKIKEDLDSKNHIQARESLLELMKLSKKSSLIHKWATDKLNIISSESEFISLSLYQQTLKHIADGNLKKAMEQLEKLVQMSPNNRFFHVIKDELSVKLDILAKSMYRAGYILEETNPLKAKEIWHKLQGLLPSNHEYSKKIKSKLKFA